MHFKRFFRTLSSEYAPLMIYFSVVLTVNYVFDFKISFLFQPAYGYTFSGRFMSVTQASLSMMLGGKGVPPLACLQYGFYFSLLATVNPLTDRLTLFSIWFLSSFIYMIASGNPRTIFYSTVFFLFSMLAIFLWGLNAKYGYVWMFFNIFYLNPVITFLLEYLAVVLTLWLSYLIVKAVISILTPREKERSRPLRIESVCPNCGAVFKSQPEYCSACGFHIKEEGKLL